MVNKTIFVSVAGFCDPHLQFTLDGLFAAAADPSRVYVAVIDQSTDDNKTWLKKKPYYSKIRYVQIHPVEARGVSWARSIAFSLYQSEDYFFQIDSHTCFQKNWDIDLINLLSEALPYSEKPIISTYPPPFQFDKENKPFGTLKPSTSVFSLGIHQDTRELTETSVTLRFKVVHKQPENPAQNLLEGFHVAGGFIFTLGKFIEEVPYDPYMYFHGEEQNLALRAYTRGWTIYHPRQNKIPLFHLYKKSGESYQSHHWNAEYEAQRATKWVELRDRANKRLCDLVSGKKTGVWGLGNVRTLDDFIALSGIDYKNKKIIEK